MEFTAERSRVIERMFDAALKAKMDQWARKYDYGLIFDFWAWIVKTGCLKTFFCKWKWRPNMTLTEAIDCLDDYLESLLQMHLKMYPAAPAEKSKSEETEPPKKSQICRSLPPSVEGGYPLGRNAGRR